ncbi:D-alanyl-D-alanine dipeptidase [Streptomyces sp. SID7760]|nr:D-alanyl-D-alanine dipeptidase [Streptomyces sp. SID7760]
MKKRTPPLVTAAAVLALGSLTPAAHATATAAAHAAPASKAPADFVALSSVDPSIVQDMRYATKVNFIGRRIDGYREPLCILTRPAAEALHRAQAELLPRGYSLKVYDCYRPQRAVDHFVRWAKDLDDERMKAEFYPRVAKDRLFADGYIAEKSGHSRGSTVDLTIVERGSPSTGAAGGPARPVRPCYAPQGERRPDDSADMGTGFDCFDTLAHTDDPRIEGVQRANRQFLKGTLAGEGFVNLPEEWWHFTYKPETYPDTYFDFPVAHRSLAAH